LSANGEPIKPLTDRQLALPGQLVELAVIAIAYLVAAKAGLELASVNPSATPIWPPTGLAVAAVLLRGMRVWPAVFLGAWFANTMTAGSLATATVIAAGNTLECVIGGFLINLWCGGRDAFSSPTRIGGYALIMLIPTAISATIGVSSLTIAGFAAPASYLSIWLTWWLGNVAGALVITPAIVLWAQARREDLSRGEWIAAAGVVLGACLIGVIAFSPLLQQTGQRNALGFLAILPLIWAGLYRGPRDTATVAVVLSAFAIWGAAANTGPFARSNLNDSFLTLLVFMISCTIPSLVLAADVAIRRKSEADLRRAQDDLDHQVTERTRQLAAANSALQAEIAQRKATDAQFRLQTTQLTEAQRFANLGSWTWDAATGKVNWSDQLLKIYGVAAKGFGGTFEDFFGRVHPDDRARVKETISNAFGAARPFRLEERILRPNGEVRHLISSGEIIRDDNGTPIGMLGVCQDMTDRQMVETSLRTTEEQYRLLVDSVRDYAIYMLDRNGIIVSWNVGAARIKGYSGFEIIGRSYRQFFTPEDLRDGVPERALETAARVGKFESEGWRIRKDGSRFFASVLLAAIRDESGKLIGYVKITRDITERVESHKALEEAREQLAQSQKMEALGQLTGGIAHDFNNILMIASGHAQLLRRRLTEPRHLQAVDAIRTAAARGEGLTRQLLAFARRQPLSPIVIDIGERIMAVRDMLGSSLRGDIQLLSEISDDLWRAEVDLAEFELALVNIAVNARDAMPDGGTITLSARNVTQPLDLPANLRGDFIVLRMTDTGSGIPPEVLSRVFEPFFTTKAVGKGTGLGLSQVYGFAQQSGGAATVESEVGRGTTLSIYLPRSHASPPLPAADDGSAVAAAAEGTILTVEDNIEVAEVTAALLEELGYRVLRARNAAEALDRMARSREIDLVFSDIVMPGAMNGLALAQEINSRYPGVPVVLTSGYSDAVRTAATQFPILRKPFEVAALAGLIRQAMESTNRRPAAFPASQETRL
jgi:PAS domain S-box-containing protein